MCSVLWSWSLFLLCWCWVWWSRLRRSGTASQEKPSKVTYFSFFTSIKLESNCRHIWSTFTVSCRWKGHVACLQRYEGCQLAILRQVFSCPWELWCCQTGTGRQVGRQSDQVRTESCWLRQIWFECWNCLNDFGMLMFTFGCMKIPWNH